MKKIALDDGLLRLTQKKHALERLFLSQAENNRLNASKPFKVMDKKYFYYYNNIENVKLCADNITENQINYKKIYNSGRSDALKRSFDLFNRELQHEMDVRKWIDSEKSSKDTCGTYEYCAYCAKQEETPCANAYERMIEAVNAAADTAVKAEETKFENESLGKKFDYDKVMEKKANRKSLTFAEKYALSDEIVKERYALLKAALTDTPKGSPKIKSRVSKQCDTYRRDGDIVCKITIIGSSLRMNLPLDPDAPEFNDGKTPHADTGHKKVYEFVPFQFKVNSKLAMKRALKLIELVK